MQLSYNLAPSVGRVGAIAESAKNVHLVTRVASVAIPFGCLVVRDASDILAKLPTTALEVQSVVGSGGIAAATNAMITADGPNDPTVPTFPIKKEFAALRKGPIFVLVEQDVVQGNQAYVRFATSTNDGTKIQQGAFRKDYDGTAQVDTITPTAVNSTPYSMEIQDSLGRVIGSAGYVSDASATAAEIVTGLIAALGVVPGITLSGTNTLIMTSSVAGQSFTTTVGANLAVAHTTANAKTAEPVPGLYYKTSASAGSLAVLEANLGGK